MADTGWVFAGTGANRGVFGEDWANPGNITADDNSVASIVLPNFFNGKLLAASNFDFSGIPAGSTIDGIEARAGDYREAAGSIIWGTNCRLILADDSDGTENKSSELLAVTGSNQTDEMGGAADLWSETIGLSDVQDVDWGFSLQVLEDVSGGTFLIDFMQMKVYYTEGASPGPQPFYHRKLAGLSFG